MIKNRKQEQKELEAQVPLIKKARIAQKRKEMNGKWVKVDHKTVKFVPYGRNEQS